MAFLLDTFETFETADHDVTANLSKAGSSLFVKWLLWLAYKKKTVLILKLKAVRFNF